MVVRGIVPKRLLIRAAGPALAPLGVSNALPNPRFRVVNSANATVAANDNWNDASDPAGLRAAETQAGAFPFTEGSLDAAAVVLLPPDNYTIVVESGDDASGVALVEAYELPP
jgi:hypothetical protein